MNLKQYLLYVMGNKALRMGLNCNYDQNPMRADEKLKRKIRKHNKKKTAILHTFRELIPDTKNKQKFGTWNQNGIK